MTKKSVPLNEFSRPVPVSQLGTTPYRSEMEATPEERALLAKRFGLVALERLVARIALIQIGKDLYRLEGHYDADLVQSCVVTLQPVPDKISSDISQLFTSNARLYAAMDEGGDEAGDDIPDLVEDGVIDVGEAIAQLLAVAMNPYPRAPGAALPQADEAGESSAHPFSSLKQLLEKSKKREKQ